MPIPLGLQPLENLDPTVGFISQAIIAEADNYAEGSDEDFSKVLVGGDTTIVNDQTLITGTSFTSMTHTDADFTVANRLQIQITTATVVASGKTGQIRITGTDANDGTLTETIDFGERAANDDAPAVFTDEKFKTVTDVESKDFGAGKVTVLGGIKTPKVRNTTNGTNRGFHPTQMLMTDINIMDEGENIQIPYYTGDAGDTKDASGPTTIGGSIMISASGDGDELLLAGLTQANNPTAVKRTGAGVGSGTIPTSNTVVVNTQTLGTTGSLASLSHTDADFTSPTRAVINFNSAAAVASGKTAVIEIEGTCLDGSGAADSYTKVTERFTFTGSQASKQVKSQVFYKTITDVKTANFSAGAVDVWGLESSAVVTFNPQDSVLNRFWLMEIFKGIVGNAYVGVIPTGMSFNFERSSAIVYDVSFTGRRAFLNQDFNGRIGADAKKLNASGLSIGTVEVMTGWQCELRLNDVPAPITSATFNMQQNLEPTNVISGERFEAVKPVRGTRNVGIDLTVIYAPQNDFAKIFRNNTTMRAELIVKHNPFGGFPWRKSFIMPNAQITSNPDADAGEGLLTQDISLKSFVSDIGLSNPDDISIVCDYSEYKPVRSFS